MSDGDSLPRLSERPDLNRRHPAPKALKDPSQRLAGIHNLSESFMTERANLYDRSR